MTPKEIIQEELAYWRAEQVRAASGKQFLIHGAVCAILWAKGKSLAELRTEYKHKERRSKTDEFKSMKFDMLAKNRAKYGMKAIEKLGIRLKELDEK